MQLFLKGFKDLRSNWFVEQVSRAKVKQNRNARCKSWILPPGSFVIRAYKSTRGNFIISDERFKNLACDQGQSVTNRATRNRLAVSLTG